MPSNTVFIKPTNGVCNNRAFSAGTILCMHETTSRLYQVARAMRGIQAQTELAKALNESSQTVNNWETRGISTGGALKAQREFGCDANWVLTGSGHVLAGWPFSPELLATVRDLDPAQVLRLENVMRSHLGVTPITLGGLQLVADLRTSPKRDNDTVAISGYAVSTKESADRLLDEAATPAGIGHGSQADHGTKRAKSHGSARGAARKGQGR